VPSLLLLTARHLVVHDPPRVLGWRLLHEGAMGGIAGALGPLLPRPAPELDRDPIALALAAIATALALAYLVAALAGLSARVRLSRAVLGAFDPRVVTLVAFFAAGVLAFRLPARPEHGLAACAAVWLSPLVYWQQVFGANDVLVAALLLGAVHLARAGRDGAA